MRGQYTDLSFIRENSFANTRYEVELIQLFLHSTPKMVNEMQKAFDQHNWLFLQTTAHKLKSNFLTFGTKGLEQPVVQLEQFTGAPEQIAHAKNNLQEIEKISSEMCKELELELASLK